MSRLWWTLVLVCWYATCAATTYDLFEENGKVGLKDEQGKVLIPAIYESLGWSEGAFSSADGVTGYRLNGMWGLINMSNQRITKPEYTAILRGEGTHIVAFQKSKNSLHPLAGCISTSGKVFIPFLYDGLKLSGMRAVVTQKKDNQFKYGLVDLDNKVLIPILYKSVWSVGSLRFAVENWEGKIALYSEDGKQMVPFSINRIEPFEKDYAVIHQNNKLGLINREGKVVVDARYREINTDDTGKVTGKTADEWIVLDGQNTILQTLEADSLVGLGANIFKIANAGAIQLLNDKFEKITEELFADIEPFHNGRAIFIRDNRKGIINTEAQVVIENLYDEILQDEKFVRAFQRKQNRWLLLQPDGTVLTSKNYDVMNAYNGAFFPVKYRNYWGGVDLTGKEIITCVYDSLLDISENRVVVKFRGQYGIISTNEDWIVTPQSSKLISLSADRYLAYNGRTTELRSTEGSVIYFTENPTLYKESFLEESTSTGGIWKINMDGQIVTRQLPPQEPYEVIFPATEEFRGIKKNGRYGFIDDLGRLRIANRYEGIQPFQEGVAAVKIRGHWGFIDLKENLIIQPTFDEVSDFLHGISIVKQGTLYGLLDITGKVVLPVRYERIERLPNKRFKVFTNEQEGLADADGKLLVMPKYQQVTDLNNGYVLVGRDGKYGLLTTQGVSTIPMIYSALTYDKLNNRYLALKKSEWQVVR